MKVFLKNFHHKYTKFLINLKNQCYISRIFLILIQNSSSHFNQVPKYTNNEPISGTNSGVLDPENN